MYIQAYVYVITKSFMFRFYTINEVENRYLYTVYDK